MHRHIKHIIVSKCITKPTTRLIEKTNHEGIKHINQFALQSVVDIGKFYRVTLMEDDLDYLFDLEAYTSTEWLIQFLYNGPYDLTFASCMLDNAGDLLSWIAEHCLLTGKLTFAEWIGKLEPYWETNKNELERFLDWVLVMRIQGLRQSQAFFPPDAMHPHEPKMATMGGGKGQLNITEQVPAPVRKCVEIKWVAIDETKTYLPAPLRTFCVKRVRDLNCNDLVVYQTPKKKKKVVVAEKAVMARINPLTIIPTSQMRRKTRDEMEITSTSVLEEKDAVSEENESTWFSTLVPQVPEQSVGEMSSVSVTTEPKKKKVLFKQSMTVLTNDDTPAPTLADKIQNTPSERVDSTVYFDSEIKVNAGVSVTAEQKLSFLNLTSIGKPRIFLGDYSDSDLRRGNTEYELVKDKQRYISDTILYPVTANLDTITYKIQTELFYFVEDKDVVGDAIALYIDSNDSSEANELFTEDFRDLLILRILKQYLFYLSDILLQYLSNPISETDKKSVKDCLVKFYKRLGFSFSKTLEDPFNQEIVDEVFSMLNENLALIDMDKIYMSVYAVALLEFFLCTRILYSAMIASLLSKISAFEVLYTSNTNIDVDIDQYHDVCKWIVFLSISFGLDDDVKYMRMNIMNIVENRDTLDYQKSIYLNYVLNLHKSLDSYNDNYNTRDKKIPTNQTAKKFLPVQKLLDKDISLYYKYVPYELAEPKRLKFYSTYDLYLRNVQDLQRMIEKDEEEVNDF